MRENVATVRLRETLSALPAVLDDREKAALRSQVHDFVDASRQKSWPIERIIVAIKQLAAEAGLRTSTDLLRAKSNLELRDALLLDVVRWSVERFYGYTRGTPPRGSPPGPGTGTGMVAAPAVPDPQQ